MRRVSTIALVHESLLQGSQEAVHFDEVIDRCLRLAVDAASATVHRAGTPRLTEAQVEVRTEKIGRVGSIRAEEATPLALVRSEEHTSELQSRGHLVCRLLLEKKNVTSTFNNV